MNIVHLTPLLASSLEKSLCMLNAVRCPYVCNAGRGRLSSKWRHNENDVIMKMGAAWRVNDWRHLATGCTALVECKITVLTYNIVTAHQRTYLCNTAVKLACLCCALFQPATSSNPIHEYWVWSMFLRLLFTQDAEWNPCHNQCFCYSSYLWTAGLNLTFLVSWLFTAAFCEINYI